MKNKIGIIADSSSGLSIKDLTEMNLGFCPLIINFSDNTTINDDPHILKNEEFYDRMANKQQLAKTSQTPLGEMTKIWKEMLKQYEKVIFIPLSKGLSGQYNTALTLANEPSFKNKVYVFDSNGVSVINWLLVRKAYEMTINNQSEINDVLAALKAIKDNYLAFILPYDLNYLVRGGRISKTAAALAKSFKLKPILTFDGTIDKFDTTRTWKKAINTTLKEINKIKKFENITLFYIIHAFASPELIDEVTSYVNNHNIKNIKVINLANVICAHTGLNTFSFIIFDLDYEKLPQLLS